MYVAHNRTSFLFLGLCGILSTACGSSSTNETPDAGQQNNQDSGTAKDAGQQGTADSGSMPDSGQGQPDSGSVPDSGTVPDAGMMQAPPVALFELRELTVNAFGSDAHGNAIYIKDYSLVPESGCKGFQPQASWNKNLGQPILKNLASTRWFCTNQTNVPHPGIWCATDGGAPIPVAGSSLDTGPWLTAMAPVLGVEGGSDLGKVEGMAEVPSDYITISEPASLPSMPTGDLEVRYSSTGSDPAMLEVELVNGSVPALVVCRPDSDGQPTIPQGLPTGTIRRLSVMRWKETILKDGQDRSLAVRVLKGIAIHP